MSDPRPDQPSPPQVDYRELASKLIPPGLTIKAACQCQERNGRINTDSVRELVEEAYKRLVEHPTLFQELCERLGWVKETPKQPTDFADLAEHFVKHYSWCGICSSDVYCVMRVLHDNYGWRHRGELAEITRHTTKLPQKLGKAYKQIEEFKAQLSAAEQQLEDFRKKTRADEADNISAAQEIDELTAKLKAAEQRVKEMEAKLEEAQDEAIGIQEQIIHRTRAEQMRDRLLSEIGSGVELAKVCKNVIEINLEGYRQELSYCRSFIKQAGALIAEAEAQQNAQRGGEGEV